MHPPADTYAEEESSMPVIDLKGNEQSGSKKPAGGQDPAGGSMLPAIEKPKVANLFTE